MKIRTGYSFRSAVGMIDEVIARLQKINYKDANSVPIAPISDRASTFGHVRWSKATEKTGLKPIFGVELAVTDNVEAKKPVVDHWAFFAIDDIESIHELLWLATSQFRYEPLLSYQDAMSASGVIKITGHKPMLDYMMPQDDLFVALGPSTSKGLINQADRNEFQFIATSDNKYTEEGQQSLYEVICGRKANTQSYPQWILDKDEWYESIQHKLDDYGTIQQAYSNFKTQAARCTSKLRKATLLRPPRKKSLRKMCEEGAKRIGVELNDEYEKRLQKELKLIKDKDFEDYFYIIAETVSWARDQMAVGPARGSSAGSLVCYLLGITTVDPLKHGLIFERFIDINRDDLPDIDIDFSDQKREFVFEHLEHLYGTDRVARLGTVALYKPRSAISETGAALGIPRYKCEAVLESLIQRSGGDSRALQTLEDTLKDTPAGQELMEQNPEILMAGRMEGHPRHSSQHAAGIVITEEPVSKFVAVDARTGATHCDKKDAEEINLLKIDALGLTQLSVFEDTLSMLGEEPKFLDKIPLDDQEAIKVLNDRKFAGIFQFNGQALQSVCRQFKVTRFEDIVSITALARPGPLATGGAHQWVNRKNGDEAITYPHESFKPYTEETLGIVIYQEQVMEICRNVGQLSWSDVVTLRRTMSKSLGKEYFDQFRAKFVPGAMKTGLDEESAIKVWEDLCSYGSWSFNKSHAVSYGLMSYYCCWLKAHHPFEFAAATLSHEKQPEKQISLLRELHDEGIDYVPVDKDRSTDRWIPGKVKGKKVLVGPVHNVKGIGPKLVEEILRARYNNEPLPSRAEKLLSNPETPIDSLWPVRDAFDRLLPDPVERNIHTSPAPISKLAIKQETYEALIFCVISRINPRDENETVLIQRRGYEITDGMTTSLNLQLSDDTDTIFGKITRYDYVRLGKPIVDRGRPGKCLYAMKGRILGASTGGSALGGGSTFRVFIVKKVKYIGDINDKEPAKLEMAQ